MIRAPLAAAALLLASLPATARADEEPLAPQMPPDVEGPLPPPPDAPLPPPEPPGLSDTIVPRPTEAPIDPEPEVVPPRFGSPGQVMVTGEFGLSISFSGFSGNSQAKRFGASIYPGLDVFVARNFSVGASAYVSHGIDRGYLSGGALTETTRTAFGIGPRVGYAIPIDRWVTLYPRITFGVSRVDAKTTLVSGRLDPLTIAPNAAGAGESTSPYV